LLPKKRNHDLVQWTRPKKTEKKNNNQDYTEPMDSKKEMPQMVLAVLLMVYFALGYRMPESLATYIDTPVGKIAIGAAVLALFAYSNPVLAVLGALIGFQMIRGASIKTGMAALEAYYPTEEKKWSPFTPAHQFPYTLEQEVVKDMTTQKFNSSYVRAPYRPNLDETHDAEMLSA